MLGALEDQAERFWKSRQVSFLNEQVTHRNTKVEVCSVKQWKNFKGNEGRITNICKNISSVFDATCQKFTSKSKSNRGCQKRSWTVEACMFSVSC